MPEVPAVRVSSTFWVPEMVGLPAGASLASCTVTMMVWSAVFSRSPVPEVACTVTTYWLLLAALEGVALAASPGSSKLGAAWKVSSPALVIANRDWSAPPVIE